MNLTTRRFEENTISSKKKKEKEEEKTRRKGKHNVDFNLTLFFLIFKKDEFQLYITIITTYTYLLTQINHTAKSIISSKGLQISHLW